jgi:uncharacterized protein YutE (UPF0331/DUF86 family)
MIRRPKLKGAYPMYFVDRGKLEERLLLMERLTAFLEDYTMVPSENEQQRLAFERAIHVVIEAVLDVGNEMIDGFIMRDPGSYEDIIEILRDESVVSEKEAEMLTKWVLLRKLLVNQYHQDHTEEVWKVYQSSKPAILQFPIQVRTYLQEQLGPISAFIPSSN